MEEHIAEFYLRCINSVMSHFYGQMTAKDCEDAGIAMADRILTHKTQEATEKSSQAEVQ